MDQEQFDFFIDESTQEPINVLVCDNESLFREILVTALDKEPTINIVGAAASGLEAIELSKESKPDVVLMDIELGEGPNGITVASDIKEAFPDTGIVVLSSHRDKEFLSSILEHETSGWSFLLKQSIADIHSLARAIESAAAGQVTMDPSVMNDLFPRQRSVLERLTHEQMEALMFISSGYADSAISEELKIDENLVEPLLQTIYNDLHIDESDSVDQRVQATLLYLQETAQVSS
jgi:DNA-binding NarL/FixJ family response regulator